ncbi:unnamed protein product [Leptidea sinapis]|uniref:Uncharacterized protein n=1 Tax=Leptidea sinapis TaxID=189913 RepID=A0A5E4QXU3_9NEOP|nr:unnamed protein product [Leptidea sinapis]
MACSFHAPHDAQTRRPNKPLAYSSSDRYNVTKLFVSRLHKFTGVIGTLAVSSGSRRYIQQMCRPQEEI